MIKILGEFTIGFSQKTLAQVLADLMVNLASGWFGVLLVSPGIFGVSSLERYLRALTINLPFGILGLVAAYMLTEFARKT